ncbi:hypothetical protein FWH58_03860 [Candidatus Saccharibacteria bacterium]|nr:hypothetical protein [Candidatus Saccharibacteria bacterium]
MQHTIIATYVASADNSTPPQFANGYYRLAYEQLFHELIQQGASAICVYNAADNYLGNGIFKQYWLAVQSNNGITYKKFNGEIKVDILYNKYRAGFKSNDLLKINPDIVQDITADKYLSYLFAPEFHAPCYFINDGSQLATLALSNSGIIALKELDSNGGKKVFIGHLSNYHENLRFPLLAQEFIDTSGGTPEGLANGIHDVRVGLFNGTPIHGLLREPVAEGELRANFALGGRARGLFVSEIPEILIEKTKCIDTRFKVNVPRFFSADWGYDRVTNEWRLFELNNAPGLAHESEYGSADNEYMELLAQMLIRSASLVA